MPILVSGAKTRVLNQSSIGMYHGMYWHVLVCNGMYWISVQHTGFRPAVQVLACILVCNGMYQVSILHVFKHNTCYPNLEAYIVLSIAVYIGMYWLVLVCLRIYMLVLDHKLIVNIPIWCHAALESTFNAISTVDTAEMSLCSFQSQALPRCHMHPQDSTYPSCLACCAE